MNDMTSSSPETQTWIGVTSVAVALASQNIGAALAKHLFPLVGAAGMTALRVGLAACLLAVIRRPWKSGLPAVHVGAVVRYGAMLGLMNLIIYQAFARIPIGIAVAIEVLGPLAVVLTGARRAFDLIWLAAALLGLGLLLPLKADAASLDPVGIAFAVGAAVTWAFYIVFGKRISASTDLDAVSWGMVVAAVITVPIGFWQSGEAMLSPHALLLGLAIAALSSALPYSLEMAALRRLPSHVFGMLVSASPAVAALAGFLFLDEQLTLPQWFAIALIVAAAAGSAAWSRPAKAAAPAS